MAVTVESVCSRTVQVVLLPVHPPPLQPPNTDGATGVAVSRTVVSAGKLVTHEICVLAQLNSEGETITVPVPPPAKLSVRVGSPPPLPPPPPLELTKQTTLAVIEPVTTAPDADRPLASAFVCTVAEIRVLPQAAPVAVSRPVELTVNISGVLDAQVTWSVMSLVTGG